MEPFGPRRSTRNKHARDKEKEESTEGAVRDNDAEGTVEDSPGPGSDPALAGMRAMTRGWGLHATRRGHESKA